MNQDLVQIYVGITVYSLYLNPTLANNVNVGQRVGIISHFINGWNGIPTHMENATMNIYILHYNIDKVKLDI